jgi:hypothetical protein
LPPVMLAVDTTTWMRRASPPLLLENVHSARHRRGWPYYYGLGFSPPDNVD